jgi:predicted oxidoreductase
MTTMKSQPLGKSGLRSSRLAYGCMRISGSWDPDKVTPEMEADGVKAVLAAWEAGYTLFDHADIYGRGSCETVYGKALKAHPELKQAVVATKCGILFADDPKPGDPHRWDFSAAHIIASVEASLRRLGMERIHLFQLHRPDFLADPAEIAQAFGQLKKQGKVEHFGVSNFRPSLFNAVQAACEMPLLVNQVPIHLGDLHTFEDGTLDQCLERGVTPLAYSPLGGGWLASGGHVGDYDPLREIRLNLLSTLDKIAARLEVSRTVLALAWLLKHPAGIIPIVGTTHPDRIREAARADKVELSREDWYRLMTAARGEGLP